MPLKGAVRARYGAPYITLTRKDLQNALLSRARDLGIQIRYGWPVTEAVKTASGLDVTAGGRTHAVGALIGADGINSAVKKLAWNTKPAFVPRRGVARNCTDLHVAR